MKSLARSGRLFSSRTGSNEFNTSNLTSYVQKLAAATFFFLIQLLDTAQCWLSSMQPPLHGCCLAPAYAHTARAQGPRPQWSLAYANHAITYTYTLLTCELRDAHSNAFHCVEPWLWLVLLCTVLVFARRTAEAHTTGPQHAVHR